MRPGALLWDLDGTLIDSEPAHAAAFADALLACGLAVPAGFHDSLLGRSTEGVYAALIQQTGSTMSLDTWHKLKWEHYQRHAADIKRREAVAEVAMRWAERGLPSAVVSNSTANEVAIALAVTGLAAVLPVTVSIADVTRGKPDPEGYLLGARRLGVAPEHCIVVEDSPLGAAAGRAAGMTVIWHPQTLPATMDIPEGLTYVSPENSLSEAIKMTLAQSDAD